MRNRRLRWLDLGLIDYQSSLHEQSALIQDLSDDEIVVMCMQHPDVVTLGKNAKEDDLKLERAEYLKRSIQVVKSDRGGKITAHMPGQLVLWPLLKLSPFEGVKEWVGCLESILIECLGSFGIQAAIDPSNPGVWVGHNKIGAVGLRVKDRVSTHGVALNVCNSLDVFDTIVPCGLAQRGVTTMVKELGYELAISEVSNRLRQQFKNIFTVSRSELVAQNTFDNGERSFSSDIIVK